MVFHFVYMSGDGWGHGAMARAGGWSAGLREVRVETEVEVEMKPEATSDGWIYIPNINSATLFPSPLPPAPPFLPT